MPSLELPAVAPHGRAPSAASLHQRLTAWRRLLPGLVLVGALAAAGMALGQIDWLQRHGFSALTLAIVLGMAVGNTVYPRAAAASGAGVHFSKQSLLRLGVVLYGLRLTVQDIGHVGVAGVVIDAMVLGSTFLLAQWIGTGWLGLAEQVTVAVATVVVFGTVAIFLYPALFELNQHWGVIPGGATGFGIYAGSTIHEVAQVVAAARSVNPDVANAAVIAKMVRVMMLAPFLVGLSAWLARAGRADAPSDQASKTPLAVPWFAFGFVAVVLFNSLRWLPAPVVAAATSLDTVLLAMAMAALGLSTHLGAIRKAGIKPLLLALALFAWLVVGGAAINRWVPALIG
jgi:uncharacterized membrane protein YadS